LVGRSQSVRGLGFDGDEETLLRTSEEPFQKALISGGRKAHESIFPAVDALDLELLPWLDVVLTTNLGGQNDLAFGGDGGLHATSDIILPRRASMRDAGRPHELSRSKKVPAVWSTAQAPGGGEKLCFR